MNSSIITYLDWLLAPFYILVIYVIASIIKKRGIKKNPIYKYFLWGLYAKIGGAIGLCLIYTYYYEGGGDTLNYNDDSSALLKLLFYSPVDFFNAWLLPFSKETPSYFTNETGYLIFWNDSNAFMVDRLLVPIKLLSFDSYLVSSVLMAVVSFTGVWKLYEVFCDSYPFLYKYFAVTLLFVPSVLFWGSGILKDSWTLAAAGWYCYAFYRIFIKRDRIIFPLTALAISIFILITIKPYIFVGLLPGSMLWMVWNRLSKIKNLAVRIFAAPVIAAVGVAIGVGIWMVTSSNLGTYSTMDSMIEKAQIASLDLKQDYYHGNSFDLGDYDPTLSGVFSKFPIATVTGLFRPFLWETKNIVMVLSGIENLIILGFTFFVLLRKPVKALSNLVTIPLVLFCLIFAVFFAFSVAISTSNFGALVRLRIPMIPFLLSGLMIVNYGKAYITTHKSLDKFSPQPQTL
ncbi:MAG: hypothetical protein HY841_00655 [Bacteroidetes bacterium]|nr:hypothetical protein [Bacteroidota bacterium]